MVRINTRSQKRNDLPGFGLVKNKLIDPLISLMITLELRKKRGVVNCGNKNFLFS
jgi:hypothetical protein